MVAFPEKLQAKSKIHNKMNFIAVNLDSGYDGQEEGWFKYKE